ncbi:DUF2178 domain-containing protein [Methanobrevibacter sp. OttesenSCG-928-K11]|nr:DUF2178 domain-containing protein [Methanobrevibacter sp. OttesenSCG-928-K11]MDL2270247.1 DUF2178 domain-containing protein [Methanobrevibacter sp. OttesenSCG-928-I08]
MIIINTKIKIAILILFSFSSSISWITGLILANINFFILSLVLLLIVLPYTLKNFNEFQEFFTKRNGKVIEDERANYINEKAGNMGFGITLAINIYLGVAILTLRNIYPQYSIIAYVLFLLVIISIIIYKIATLYYKKRYS